MLKKMTTIFHYIRLAGFHLTLIVFNVLLCESGSTDASAKGITLSISNVKSVSDVNTELVMAENATSSTHRRETRDNKPKSMRVNRQRNERGVMEARIGQGFKIPIPLSMFQINEEEENAEEWSLTLRTAENHRVFANSWIFVDSKQRQLIGFPMSGNEGLFNFLIRAVGPNGRIMKRPLPIQVFNDEDRASHRVRMTIPIGFLEFMKRSRVRIQFATYISEYLQKNGITTEMSDIWVYKTDRKSRTLSWILTTFNRNVCDHTVTELLPNRLLKSGKPHPELVEKLKPNFVLTNVSVEISEYCPKPVKHTKPKSESKSQIVIGPLVVIVIVIVLGSPLLIAHIIRKNIRKRDRRRQFSQSRHMQLNGAATPIWVEQEEEDKSNPKDRAGHSKSNRYRWNPDLTGRPLLVVPNTPPVRRSASRQTSLAEEDRLQTPIGELMPGIRTQRMQNSVLTWHGLPSEQCVESESLQFPSVVTDFTSSISRPIKDVFEYFSGKPEVNGQSQLTGSTVGALSTSSTTLSKAELRPHSSLTRSEPCSRKCSSDMSRRYMLGRQDTTKSEYANGYAMRERSRDPLKGDLPPPAHKWLIGRRNSLSRQESRETTASEKSETSLLGSAFNKVSSLISLNNRQTPKVIRIFLSDESEDNTRNNSLDRSYAMVESQSSPLVNSQLSSFERPSPSLMSSLRSSFDKPSPSLVSSQRSSFDKPSPSLISSQLSSFDRNSPSITSTQVNSFDILSHSRSFSQDGSYEEQSSMSDFALSFDRESINEMYQPLSRPPDDSYGYDPSRMSHIQENGFRVRQDKPLSMSPEHIRSCRRRSAERLRSDGSSDGSFENNKRSLIRQETLRIVNSPGERKMHRQDSTGNGHKYPRDGLPHHDSQLYSLRKNSLHPDDSRTIERRLKKQKSIYSPVKQDTSYSPLHRIDTTNVHIQAPRYGQQTLTYPGVMEESSFMRCPANTEIVYENGLNIIDRVTPSRV